jgi:hypothetical protein
VIQGVYDNVVTALGSSTSLQTQPAEACILPPEKGPFFINKNHLTPEEGRSRYWYPLNQLPERGVTNQLFPV